MSRKKNFEWSIGDKATIIGTVLIISLVLGIVLWAKSINTLPIVHIPMPAMPSTNAFDHFLAAGNAVVDGKKIGFAFTKYHSPDSRDPNDRNYSAAEKQSLVAENRGALRALRVGLNYPYQNPPLRSFNDQFPYYAKFRGLARLLAVEDQAKAGSGDWNGAINADLDAIQMGGMIPHGSPLIGDLVGIACQAIGRYTAWLDVAHLNALQSETAARRLEKIETLHLPFADVLKEEKWNGQAGLMELMQKPDWRGKINDTFSDGTSPVLSRNQQLRLYFVSDKTIMDNYTQYMDRDIADARQPYSHRLSAPTPSDPLNRMLIWNFELGRFRDTQCVAGNSLLIVTLALRAYHLEHRTYPAALLALVPKYLSHIPDDPFAPSGPIQYKVTGAGYRLYSVGPDGIDDGGKPTFDASKSAPSHGTRDLRYQVQADSKGDMVAGVNL